MRRDIRMPLCFPTRFFEALVGVPVSTAENVKVILNPGAVGFDTAHADMRRGEEPCPESGEDGLYLNFTKWVQLVDEEQLQL